MNNKSKRIVGAVYILLRVSVVVMLIAQFFNRNYQNVFLCVLVLALFCLPDFLRRQLVIELPDTLEVIVLLFIYAAEILGEIREYYVHYPYWDTMLHTLNGFLCAAVGFSLIDILNRNEKIYLNASPIYLSIVAVCFSMTIGILWEFFEFGMDCVGHFDMQKDTVISSISTIMLDSEHGTNAVICKNIKDTILIFEDGTQQVLGLGGYLDIGLIDTMSDLLVNFIGALVFSIIGFFYVKNRGKGWLARRLIPKTICSKSKENDRRKE